MPFEIIGGSWASPGALSTELVPSRTASRWSNAFGIVQDIMLSASHKTFVMTNPVAGVITQFYRNLHKIAQLTYSTDQQRALENNFGNYRGQIILPMPGNSAASLGPVMLLGSDARYDDRGRNLLRHEHGHFLEYQELGILMYYVAIGLPSVINYRRGVRGTAYNNQPWEIHADMLAGVIREGHTDEAIALGEIYNQHIQSIRGLYGDLGFFRFLWDLRDFINHDLSSIVKECEQDD